MEQIGTVVLGQMSFQQLRELNEQINQQIKVHVRAAAEEVVSIADRCRIDLRELAGRRKPKAAQAKTPTRWYVDPDDAGLVWTRRGRMPKWLTRRLQGGAKLEQFLKIGVMLKS